MKTITVYKSVYNRKDPYTSDLDTFINNPESIYDMLGYTDWKEKLVEIRSEDHKPTRNEMKRAYLPAVDISESGYLSIDIDGISHDEDLKQKIIDKLYHKPSCYACMDSVSGNLVAFFKYGIEDEKFRALYYKLWLELTLELGVNIDFLPEKNRLRYISDGTVHFIHDEVNVRELVDYLEVEELPFIKAADNTPKTDEEKKIKRDIIFRSE